MVAASAPRHQYTDPVLSLVTSTHLSWLYGSADGAEAVVPPPLALKQNFKKENKCFETKDVSSKKRTMTFSVIFIH